MNKLIILSIILLTGCGTMITVPIDSTLMSKEKATIIAYNSDQYLSGIRLPLTIDNDVVGSVTSEHPLKVEVQPGEHKMYIGERSIGSARLITTKIFEAGKVYFFRAWIDVRGFYTLQKIDQTQKVDSYKAMI